MIPFGRRGGERLLFTGSTSLAVLILAGLSLTFAGIAIAAFSPLLTEGGALVFSSIASLALYTIRQAAVSTLIAAAVGLLAAFFVSKREFPLRSLVLSMSPIPLTLPSLLMALGYVLFFGAGGSLNRILTSMFSLKEPPLTFLYSFTGLVIAQGFYNFPLIMRTVHDTWMHLPPDEEEAAALLGAGRGRIFRTITLFQLLPAILSASLLVFLFCFFSFILVLLFGSGRPTLELAIYQAARVSLDFKKAAALALAETALALCITSLYAFWSKRSERSRGIHPAGRLRKPVSGRIELIIFALTAALILIFFILPLASLFISAFFLSERGQAGFSFSAFQSLFARPGFYRALLNTLAAASVSAALATVSALTFSYLTRILCSEKKTFLFTARVIPMLPLALSPVAAGFGMTMLIPRGSFFTLVVCQAALSWPFALRQTSVAAAKIPDALLEAAEVLSPSHIEAAFRVGLPLMARAMCSAFCFCFALSAADASLPLLLAIPRFDTLALYIYRLAGSYRLREASAASIILAALGVFVFYLGDALHKKEENKES